MAEPTPDTGGIHETAVQAEKYVEKLCTELAKLGASDETVKACEQMAEVLRKIVTALGKGAEHAPDEEGPPPEEEAAPPKDYKEAAGQTHQMMQEAAAKRQ